MPARALPAARRHPTTVRRDDMAKQALVAGGIGETAGGDGPVKRGKCRDSTDRGMSFEKGGSGV
jgi:hypothetical protein